MFCCAGENGYLLAEGQHYIELDGSMSKVVKSGKADRNRKWYK